MAERLSGYFGTDPREADAFLPFRRRRLRHGLTQPPQQLRNTQGRPRRIAIPRNPTGDLGRLKPALLPRSRTDPHPSEPPPADARTAAITAPRITGTKAPKPCRSGSATDRAPRNPHRQRNPCRSTHTRPGHTNAPFQPRPLKNPAHQIPGGLFLIPWLRGPPRRHRRKRRRLRHRRNGRRLRPEETPAALIAEESPAPIAAARTDRRSAAMDPDPLQARSNALQ